MDESEQGEAERLWSKHMGRDTSEAMLQLTLLGWRLSRLSMKQRRSCQSSPIIRRCAIRGSEAG